MAGNASGNYNEIDRFNRDFGTQGPLLPGRGNVTDPKREKPESDHPHEDDLSLEFQQDQEGPSLAGGPLPLEDMSLSSSTEEFHFSGPVEELDFTEPADFTFPTLPSSEVATGQSGELPGAEPAEAQDPFGADADAAGEPALPEDGHVESDVAGEGIPEVEAAEEEKPKPKRELPAWVRTAEWIAVGMLAVGAFLSVIISSLWLDNPKLVALILNIACPVMLALIPYALWRSSARWVAPAASAVYTLMLALATAALVAGTWCVGVELSRYDWQFSKARVTAAKPRPIIIATTSPPAQTNEAKGAKPAEQRLHLLRLRGRRRRQPRAPRHQPSNDRVGLGGFNCERCEM